ncbi:PREDICTED: GATA transcription factor 11-like [Tarenaya hassleriana]|uniref:GATA transcription factor 11-like n=1 Tax=Tarenaya hassleriana TaxID=28532 RepID=UPI00053C2835|nr:PREDICTED: GATA transcription factor 11-like [Tarenaya hassleriana]XP_010557329.1 PREDICTED: GATA transcription factor 11-like [Tarenaya hassleriana]XP_010557330.1 PREDICTED: GATA transcription factor 11-like [Tarenaya hassleriana]XP_010557331.1 PREDICTED: GATA transcription factor 11-like [Tarenaya hassleriana]XP_010557332.1 PREDICTED: GATA transcription factor 11-like [Tarenaya hassleriana]XP_010557333.1 PREDICTED: GATA transcription factor 11-like [Tarenaya hassleriana]
MNNGSWLPEVDFQGLSDDFFDDLMNHIDFPLEDVESGNGEGDWDAGFQGLEPPLMDMFSTLSSGLKRGGVSKSSGVADQKPIPILKQSTNSSESSSVMDSSVHQFEVKVSKLFQSSSPVSVLENSSSSISSQSSRSQGLSFPVVKGMRTKRKRPSALKLRLLLPFEPEHFSPDESESEVHFPSEKPDKKKRKKQKIHPARASSEPKSTEGTMRKCTHCETTKTPQWREGPNGPKTLCNACGVRFRSGRLVPEYRPAASPTFIPSVHSNSHRKIVEIRRTKQFAQDTGLIHTVTSQA